MAYGYPVGNVGDRYLVTFQGRLFNQFILSTFWYGVNQQVAGASKELVMDNLKLKITSLNELVDKYLACIGGQYTLEQIWIQPIDPIRYVKKVYNNGNAGTNAHDNTTANVAAVILRRGVRAVRAAVSTLHVPIPDQGNTMVGGLLDAGIKAALDSLALLVSAQVNTGTGYIFDPIIRHGPGTSNFDVIQFAATEPEVRIMRRRTVGLGI